VSDGVWHGGRMIADGGGLSGIVTR
jgi:hypothetical protein